LLSILLLNQAGYRVFIHGADGHTAGRLYTEHAMRVLGLPVADDWQQVAEQLDSSGLSYLPLQALCPPLEELIQLRPLLGLRSPVHTLTRMLNPLGAQASIQSIFHPAYGALHQDTDLLLQQPTALVFKGDSGEVEIKPQADTRLMLLRGGERSERLLKRRISNRVASVGSPSVGPLQALWHDDIPDDYGLESVLTTTAAALLLLDDSRSLDSSYDTARQLWDSRDKTRLSRCP
jgi:anthranilate phosphoribosyltransferase